MNNVSKRLAFLIISSSPSPRNIATTFRATRSSQSPYFAWVMVFSYEGHTGYTSRMYFPGIQGWDFFTVGAAGCKARQDNQPFQQLQQWKIPAMYSREIKPIGIFTTGAAGITGVALVWATSSPKLTNGIALTHTKEVKGGSATDSARCKQRRNAGDWV